MIPALNAFFLPSLIAPGDLSGGVAVVIDLLRASSTIAQALAAGATEVIPCLEVDQARAKAAELAATGERPLLAGEREAVRIPSFDLGNSPAEFTTEAVAGRAIVFTTTNGTRAMDCCRSAARVLIGAFVNRGALCDALAALDLPCHLVCAGTKGKITREDVLAAGAIADRLIAMGAVDERGQNDQARIAREAWRETMRSSGDHLDQQRQALALALRDTQGGRNLKCAGLDHDLTDCAQLDSLHIIPELNLSEWRIVPALKH